LANAFAAPAGRIFVTTQLLDSLESDAELESLLAHEIAHVEMRHGYRQYRSHQKASIVGGILSIAIGVATRNSQVFEVANVVSQIATSIVMSGHSRQLESEADSFANLYLASVDDADPNDWYNVLRKLQYQRDFFNRESGGQSVLASHPNIESRIDTVRNSEMAVFEEAVFYGYSRDGDLVATLSFQAQRAYTGTLNSDDIGLQVVAFVESTSALQDDDNIDDLRVSVNGEWIKLDNKEDTPILPNDTVGVSVVNEDRIQLLAGIDAVELNLNNVDEWTRSRR
jgi:hypothetical protein